MYAGLNDVSDKPTGMAQDIATLSIFWDKYPKFSTKVAKMCLFGRPEEEEIDQIWDTFQSSWKMILSYAGMTLFNLAYNFSVKCETYAHTLEEVVNQSIAIQATWERESAQIPAAEKEFIVLLYGNKASFETKNFRELSVAAIIHKQSTDAASWANFKYSTDGLKIARDVLFINSTTHLAKVRADQTQLPAVVRDYLQNKGIDLTGVTPKVPQRPQLLPPQPNYYPGYPAYPYQIQPPNIQPPFPPQGHPNP